MCRLARKREHLRPSRKNPNTGISVSCVLVQFLGIGMPIGVQNITHNHHIRAFFHFRLNNAFVIEADGSLGSHNRPARHHNTTGDGNDKKYDWVLLAVASALRRRRQRRRQQQQSPRATGQAVRRPSLLGGINNRRARRGKRALPFSGDDDDNDNRRA